MSGPRQSPAAGPDCWGPCTSSFCPNHSSRTACAPRRDGAVRACFLSFQCRPDREDRRLLRQKYSLGREYPCGSESVPSTGAPLPTGTPKQKYDYAYAQVSNAQYEQAEASFLEFLSSHPQDELAGNAQYWLGQTYYARGNYADATRTFLEGMSKYPESSKAPAYLLKVGMSLNLLGEKQEACEVYRELNARFPDSSENTRMRPAEERKAGCN